MGFQWWNYTNGQLLCSNINVAECFNVSWNGVCMNGSAGGKVRMAGYKLNTLFCTLQDRLTEIWRIVDINKAGRGPGVSLVSANIVHKPFNVSELTFNPIGSHCVARIYWPVVIWETAAWTVRPCRDHGLHWTINVLVVHPHWNVSSDLPHFLDV